jgi:amino acid transporter
VAANPSDNEEMTQETLVARVLLVLVFAPAGGLFGKAVAVAAVGREWWPWLIAALVWLVLSGLVAMAVSSLASPRRPGQVSSRFDEHR